MTFNSKDVGSKKNVSQRHVTSITLTAITILGLFAFLYPVLIPSTANKAAGFEHAGDAPLVTAILLPLIIGVIASSLLVKKRSSKEIAVLGLLIAVNVIMRFIPLPLGGSAMFLLVILGGYIWGPPFGFLLGSLTVLVSAMWAGGFGPWVPFQMIAVGWVGMSAGFLPYKRFHNINKGNVEIAMLALYGVLWGYIFGVIMNLWFWPYLGGTGASLPDTVGKYAVFYMSTSFLWDTGRAIVNCVLLIVLGRPLLRVFERFNRRFNVVFE